MTLYVDASAILRIVLREPGWIENTQAYERRITSALSIVECRRTLERLRVEGGLADHDSASRRATLGEVFRTIDLVEIGQPILSRASEPLPTILGTLDAIHLATARIWREERAEELTIGTHDRALTRAAHAFGIPVVPRPGRPA